ncbi:titin isoform X2 [Acyrthosiphon pisum]|uniref:Uncharacterized protein n=1 Tax=Acyrthosiphon pisum TaxID=7029 RepID=A0A8R2B1V2_ACYPI|nr:titin isoform X2 [Acyrthosiphon pisum]|eukprot:XP_008180551.1 PREDICTED: uncharacterized protein LOC100159331 isoform X2 [Acyrthosiphon pisum]
MIVLFWYLVRLLFTAFRKPKPSGGSHAITFGTSTRAGDSLTTLTMKSSNNSDVGSKDYQGGSSSTVGQEDLIPIFLRRLNDLNIRVGTRTRFLIELDDATGVQVRWYHNNVEADNERYQYIHEGGFYCLDIVPVTLFDEGLWVCTAQNYAGKSSTAAHLSLTVPKAFKKPIFVEQLKAVLTQRGIVSLECKVIGVPTPKLRWYKDDKEIKAGDIFALTANSEEDCLGIYTCEATNVMGTALSTSKIQVTHTPLDGNHDADSLIPYGPPPKFVKFLKNASGKVGSVLFLECQVEVPPWPRSIGWYNDNGIVNEGPLYHLLADGLGMYGVEIKSLRADHSTTWKCVATSSTGAKAVTSCVVSVSYPKNYRVPRFLESLRAIMTDEGLVSFECKVIGYPTPQLLWFKDGKQLQPGDVYELTGSKSLGSYCCVARNCMGETSSLAELTIEDIQNQLNESEKLQLTSNTQPPRFLLGLKSIEANINESFVFMIKVTTESTPSISWYKEDEQLTESNRYQFSTEDNGTYILNIVPLEIDDQAEWKCVAINKYGQTATSSFLKLNIPKNFKRPRFLEELRIAFSNEGSVNLECKVIGVPQPQLKWFKDGQELNPGDMHKIISGQSGTCCLGTYTCQAHNCMGTVSSSATLLTMEDKSTVKSCASEEYLSVGNPLVRNESLSTIPEERTSQMEKSYTIEEPADISFSFDGKEVTVSLYETPDLTHDEALQIIEMYADELSEHISEDNVVDLPSLRIVKESSISGPVMMEALVIDVPIDFCRQQTVSDTEFDGVSLTEDITLAINDKSESICENSLEYFSDHLSSGNSKREEFYSASETTPKHSSVILKQQSGDDGHQSFHTPKLFMSDSDDQILTQLKLDEKLLSQNSTHVTGPLARSESNNTEEEVSETLAEIENEPPLSHNYCATEIVTQSDEDGLYSTVLNKIRGKGMASVILSSEEDNVLKIISRPNVDEFLKYMKIILEGTMVKMRTHENFNFTSTTTELERSIQALHSLAWKFIEETERNDVSELEKNTADNVSSLMTAINASLLALEQIDDPFGVSDNILNEIQSSVCFDLETLNNNNLPATEILDRLSDQIKNFTIVVNKQVARVTEQRIIAVLQNTIGTTLVYIKTLQQNCSKIKCVDINSLAPLFSMVQPLETILNDIADMEEASMDDNKPNFKLKQILIPPISSIAFALDNLNTALKSDSSDDDQDLKDIYDRINESTHQFMTLASHGMESNKIAECFISFTKPINDLCCHLRRLGRSTENIVSSDYGSDDKLLLDFETLFDELMIDIDTLINNVNFVQDSENNMNPLGSLLEPLQDMKIGLFQVNQVLLSNQTGSTMSYEVMSCFEHLSQQLVQLNNCIVNQSIVEETDKEIPFESSIKMMQNILFDDAIDDLGVNGILFGSVMKPLLQLQNLIVSKMASVESDLSFSEHTDVTGGACDTQSLSLSLSNNAQTVLDKTANENSKQVLIESSIIDSLDKDCDKQNNIHKDTLEIEKDSILFENNMNNDLVIKRGFECNIGETFKYDEPNIITSEDDRDNSGFEALFDETDLETISDFVEDVCLDNIMNSKVDDKLSDLLMSEKDIDSIHQKTDDIIPEHVLESLEKSKQQDLILNSPVDLFEELQETLKNMSEVARDGTTKMYDLDNNKLNHNDLQKIDSTDTNQICNETNNLLDGSIDVDQNNESETFKNKYISISDQNVYKEEQVFEIGQDVDFVENLECLDSDKSISNNTVITVNDISDSSEVKMKRTDMTNNLETVVDLLESKTVDNVPDENEPLINSVDVLNKNECLITSLHNVVSKINDNDAETQESVISNKLNATESIKNITILSSEDIMIDTNKLNESKEMNTINNYNDAENEDTMLMKEVEILPIRENVSHKSSSQNDAVINEIDAIHNLGTDTVIQVAQTRNGNEYNTENDEENNSIDKYTNATELNKVLGTLVEEKNVITPEINLVIEDYNSSIIESSKIKQCDNNDLLNKSICAVEESVISANEQKSSIVDVNSITILEGNISKGIFEEQNCGDENLSSLKNKNNASDTFETNQDVNLDKQLQYNLQPNVNQTLTTDNKQIVPNCTDCENVMNPITEQNVHQTEEYVLIKNDKNESELINEQHLDNVQQNSFIVQENDILQQSNNEVKDVKELNEPCDTLSDMKLNNEIECISSKIDLPSEIIYSKNDIDVTNAIQQCVLDGNKCVDSMLPVTELMTQPFGSTVLDKQLVNTNQNFEENQNAAEKSKQNEKNENSFESNNIIDDIVVKSKNDLINDFKSSVNFTLNEKETVSDEKINSENKTTEIVMNEEKESINTFNKSYEHLIQSTIFENNDTTLTENTLTNSEIIPLESTQSIDPCKFDENEVEIQSKENVDSRYERNAVSDDKEKRINNLEHLEAENEIIYLPDRMINKDEEKSPSEIQYIQNNETKSINKSTNIVVEQMTALIGNETISVSNVQPLDTVVIDIENTKEQVAVEDQIDTVENSNDQRDDVQEISKTNIAKVDNLKILASEINCLLLDNDQILDFFDTKNDLANNQDISENNFGKSLDDKNNLGETEDLKHDEINTEEIKEEFINLKDLEISKIKLETIIDNNLRVDSNKSTKQIENSTFKNPSKLAIGELNISSETPERECLSINKDIDDINIGSLNSNISVNETMQMTNAKVDTIDQRADISKTVTQNTADVSKERTNVITKDYSDDNHNCDSTLSISEVQENKERNTTNDNNEYVHSNKTPDTININEDTLINKGKINDEINLVTALENKASLLNDFMFESEISDLPTEEPLNILSIMPKLHCVEKIAANETECVMLENVNVLKQAELNAAENINQHAKVEHELNIAAIGNIIIDYDSIKENSLTVGEEKKSIEKATMAITLNDHSFEIVSTNVDILDGCIKDVMIKEEQIIYSDTNEASKISTRSTKRLSENDNPEDIAVNILNDQIQNTDNLVKENVETKVASLNKTTEILNDDDTHNQENVGLNKEQSELADKLQQSIKNPNQIFETSMISVEENESIDKVKSDVLITKINTTDDEKTIDRKDIEDINRKLSAKSKGSTTNNIGESENKIDTNKIINETIDLSNKELSDDNKNTEKIGVELNNLDPGIASDNNKNPEAIIEISTNNQIKLTENIVEKDKTKRGSEENKSCAQPDDKKSPSPDTTKSNTNISEINIDKTKVIGKSIDEINEKLSDNNEDIENVGVKLDKISQENVSDNNKASEEIIDKDISYVNKNQKDNEIGSDNQIKSTENVVENDKTKSGSKKKKSSPQPDDKKSPSPDTTVSNIIGSEINIDKTKVIDKSIEENNKKLLDDMVKITLDKIEHVIPPDNNKVPEEIIENYISNIDENENPKDNQIAIDNHIRSTENVEEKDKTKRGSKKKKSSPQTDYKKSPSPESTKSNTSVDESNIDTTKFNDESNEKLSDNNKDSENVGGKLDKILPEIVSEEIIEKDVSNVDKNENLKDNPIGIDSQIKSTENVVEKDKTKRGSKKKNSSPRPEDIKPPSPDTIKSNINISEINIDATKVIDKSIEEINEKLSDNNNGSENVGGKLDKILPEIVSDNNKVSEEIIEKDVSNVDKNENPKDNPIGIDSQIKSTENVVEKDKTKRGSKKKKSSPQSGDKKSPSPDTIKSNISVNELNIDTTNVNDKSNKKLSDTKEDSDNVGVKLDKILPEIDSENNKVPKEIIEKDVSKLNRNEDQKNNQIDTDNQIKSVENVVEKDNTKRGSKKKKSSPHPEDKKSPSPETTKSNISVGEINIDAKVIDKSNEEINDKLSDNKEDSDNVGGKLDKILPAIVPDNNRDPEEIIEKDVSNVDKNENPKDNLIGIESQIKSTENVVEKDKTKRGSKKKKSSLQSGDKKSPSPDTVKTNISVNELNIDTTNVNDKSNKKLSNNKEDSDNVGVKLDKILPEIDSENNKVPKEIIEKDDLHVNKNENQKNNQIGTDNQIKSTENVVEKDKTKRGSKKKKSSPHPEDKKSPSPETTKSNISVGEINIDAKVIDKSNEEINDKLSDNKEDSDNVGGKLDKILPAIVPDNNRVPEEIIEKDVSNVDKNENQKDNLIGIDSQIKSTENVVEKDKEKRGSKKKKSSPHPEDKKSPSPETTKSNISVGEINIDETKVIDKSIEENNKKLSNEIVEIKLDKIKQVILRDDNNVSEEIIEKGFSNVDRNENPKDNPIGTDNQMKSTENIIEKDETKRGSKKKISGPQPDNKKSPSSDTTNSIISASENKIDTIIIDVTVEDKNRKISDNNKNYAEDGTIVEPEMVSVNNKSMIEIIEKDFSNNNQSKNQTNGEISIADKIKSTKEDKTNRECEKDKSIPLDKINKKTNEKLEINNEIEKNENTISDLRENFTEQLPNSNILLEKMERGRTIKSLENNNIDTIEKSKKNIIDTHLVTNPDKSVTDNDKKERGSVKQGTSTKSPLMEKSVKTDTIVNENVDVKPKDNTTHFLTNNKKVRTLSGMTEHDVIDVPEIRSSDKRPVNRYLLDVTDALKSRPNSLAYRSLTPDPLTSYRSLTPDHMSSYRSLTPECPSYRSSLTPRSKYTISSRFAGSSDRDLYGGSSSSRSSRSSSRSTSPYPPESRISARSLWPPTNLAAYRCLSETSIPLSPRRMEVEATSGWPHTSYGVTTRRRRGSDSFLHDSGVRDGGYYSSWRLSDGRTATHSATEDLYRAKEAFKGLYFCVRMIDQTVSSGARVKFWCSVIGHPEPRVQWYRDGQKLNSFTYNSSARYQTKYDGGLAQLIVDNAQSGDSGEYTCVATNGRDRISTTGFLTVYTSPSVFRKPLLQPSLSVEGTESGRGLYSRTSHDFRLSANDKFDFGCQKFGGDLATRRPEYPKFVSSIIADDVATYGGTIALQVRVQGSPVPNVTWMRESKPLPRLSGKYVYLDEGGLYTLLVMDSTAGDGGKYVCRACNLYGVADTEKAVRVVSPQDYTDRRGVKPAIIVSRPNDRLNVAVGEDITVTLRVAGEPKPKVIWMRGSRDVTFLDRSLKETVNDYVMLSIKKAQPSDAGTYFIIAKNVYGSDRAFVTVGVRKRARSLTPPQIRNTIGRWFGPTGGGGRGGCANNEVPGPVRSEPTVTDRTNNRISLQWDRPEKPETVLVYRVETRSVDEECWRQVGMTPTNTIDVYNLKPGYRYQFRVAARNRFGWSQPVASEGYVDVFEPKCLPEFRQPLPGQTRVLLRHSATLQCHVRGVPEPRVRWFKDGEPLLASDRHAVGRTDGGKCTLTIADAVDCDAGRYSCEAVNDQGRVCTLTVVQVIANRKIVEAERRLQGCLMKNNDFKESAPVFTKHLIDRRVDINSTVRLSCQVNGLPTPLVLWYKDGRPVDFASGTEGDRKPPVRDDSNDFYTLELTRVKYDDSGTYAAVASNAIGKASTRCVLEVFNKNRTDPAVPSFVFGLPPTSEAVDSIVLSAQIDAYRPVKVEWFRDGIQLRNGRRVDIITDHDGNLELRIACVTNRDSGTYMLRVSNDTGTVESRCEVNVVEREHKDTGMEQISLINHLYSKKPKFVVKPKFQEVEEGQEVIIDSEIVGDPLPKITWLRDGLKPEYYRDNSEFLCVSNGNRYQLKIPHAKLTHTGTYTLLASNPHGQIKALISLQVYSTGHCKKKMENGTNHATVERLPRISRGLVDIECRENDSVSFECKLNITQETDIRWQKDGKLVRLGKHIKSQLVDGDTARLDISTASPLHEGLYTCTAFNELGQDSTSARLVLLSDSQDTAKAPQSNGQRNTMLNSPILAGETNDRCTKRLKRSSGPKFYAVLHDRIADVGETVRFLCSVSGHPPPWSSWEKDGQPIGVNSRMRIREDDDHRSLEICDVTSDDAGLYRITVENKFGKIQATARLEVLTHNQTTNDVQITSSSNGRRQSGSAACAGENFTLSCDIRGNSMSDVTWYKDDEKIKPDGRVTSSLDDLAARLSISNLELVDTGVYTCVARCESGVTRCSTELCVFDTKPATDSYLQPPIFVEGLVPKRTADEGEPVQLTVRLQGAVPMSASWFKNDVPVPDCTDFEYVVADDRGEFGLSITDPFVKDSGTYSCKVANSFGQAVSSGQLVINEMSSEQQVPTVAELNNNLQDVGEKTASDSTVVTGTALPASILRGPCDTTVLRGAKVVLETSYQGDPEPCVQWLRAGKVLESNAHLCITNGRGVSSLTIDSITADDCGKYVVRVDNGHGNDFHYASVAVEGPPDPPAGRPVVSVSETSADVTWSSPAYDGGCMVTGYGVEVRPFNQSDWKLVADKCHSLSHIVRGLAPGESYVFRVRAENMHGSSEASLESTPVYILQTDYGNTLWPKTVNIDDGELFDEQYEVLDELGKGRYGVVYKVKERETNKFYAAKFVRCIKSSDKEKAQEEVDIMNCLRHPKLLQLDAAFDKPREVVLVTEYISGGELFERVVADDFTLTEKDCILFTRQICEGVDYMHKQNVVHLDLKPENIMCQSRTSHSVKLIDFGLAQKIVPGQPMRVLFGTPEFIPPEIIGYEPIGLESDMWSVGVICYVLLSGLSPFMGDNDPETFTNITKAEFDFDDEAFDAVSQDAKDFISALLIKRKELRLTARECLKHKWLAQQDMDMSCVILSTDKLKKFIIRRKWQKTGNAIRALGRMATLSAASRRGVSGGSSAGGGGGGGTGGGCGTVSVLQKLKMTCLREEESAGEAPSETLQEMAITETTKNGSGHRSCDARSDSGFSDCPSLASPTATLVRPAKCPSAISEETPPVSDQDRSPPPPSRRSPSLTTHRSPSPVTHRSPSPPLPGRPSSPATRRPSSTATRRPPSPATHRPTSPTSRRPTSPATRRPFSPSTRRPLSPTTRGSSYTTTRGPSPLATHLRSPLPRNRRDATHPVHDVPLPAGTGVSGMCKTNRIIFDNGRRDGNASSPGIGGGGVQRKEPIRIQTADNFQKAIAFWKQ